VVRNEITAIGGRIEIATTRGKGTSFAIHIPLTLAVTQVVLVRAGSTVVAISSAMVEQVMRMKEGALAELYSRQNVAFQDRVYPLHSLATCSARRRRPRSSPTTRCCCFAAASSASPCTSTS